MLSLAWVYIFLAGLLEPLWVVGMKKSEGFKSPKWTVATMVFLVGSMYLLALGIDMDLPVGTAYAVWTGIGAVGALIAGMVLFKEKASRIRVFFIMLVIAGIMGVQLTAGA